jgi:hypothetical protein
VADIFDLQLTAAGPDRLGTPVGFKPGFTGELTEVPLRHTAT